MKALLPILLAVLWMPGLAAAEDEGLGKKEGQKLAADLMECPEGHKALKDIPIVYGEFHERLFRLPPEKLEPDERRLYDRMQRDEVIVMPEPWRKTAPKSAVICTECKFRYWEPGEDQGVRLDPSWQKQSDDMAKFKVPFSETFRSFPRVEPLKAAQSFSQYLREDGKQVAQESMGYATNTGLAEVVAKLRAWLVAQKIDAELLAKSKGGPEGSYEYSDRRLTMAAARQPGEDGKPVTMVYLKIRHPLAAGADGVNGAGKDR